MRHLSCLVVATVAFSLPVFAQSTVKPVGDAKRGEVLAARWCGTCHLQPGQSGATDVAPPFQQVARIAASDPGFIRAFLNKPHAPMPPLNLNQAEIADLIAYLTEQGQR
jgi:mono/diheme cytochrome c family protein